MGSKARILDAITKPADLHLLSNDELAILCKEIREEIIATTSQTGGHLGSSLGAVEIMVASLPVRDEPLKPHRLYRTP